MDIDADTIAQNAVFAGAARGPPHAGEGAVEIRRLETSALQDAIFNSAYFSSIATDEKGVIQIFNVGAERMLGYTAAEVMNKITPADISDPQEVIARAANLSSELRTLITPGFEALVFKASRGIEDIYELTYIRKDGSRFPAIVSVTALRNEAGPYHRLPADRHRQYGPQRGRGLQDTARSTVARPAILHPLPHRIEYRRAHDDRPSGRNFGRQSADDCADRTYAR